jgi:hypothetical protein
VGDRLDAEHGGAYGVRAADKLGDLRKIARLWGVLDFMTEFLHLQVDVDGCQLWRACDLKTYHRSGASFRARLTA